MSVAPDRTQPRSTYVHLDGCRAVSSVSMNIAQQIADDDCFDDLYCSGCRTRKPIVEFYWVDSDGSPSDESVKIQVEEEE
jgi:hypothetical protein